MKRENRTRQGENRTRYRNNNKKSQSQVKNVLKLNRIMFSNLKIQKIITLKNLCPQVFDRERGEREEKLKESKTFFNQVTLVIMQQLKHLQLFHMFIKYNCHTFDFLYHNHIV